MANEYAKVPVTAGQILASPNRVAVSKKSNVMALVIPLTGGVMLQAFRVTPTGIVAIPVNGQLSVSLTQVGVSPTGKFIVAGNLNNNNNQPRFHLWKYNETTSQYDYVFAAPSESTRQSKDFQWLEDDVVVMARSYASGSTFRGGCAVYRLFDTGATLLYEYTNTDYNAQTVAVSKDRRDFFVGHNGASNIAESFSWNGGSATYNGRTVVGAYAIDTLPMGTGDATILGGRGGSGPGVSVFTTTGEPGSRVFGPRAQSLTTNSASYGLRHIHDDKFFMNLTSGMTFWRNGQAPGTFEVAPTPTGLQEIAGLTTVWEWSRFSDTGIIVGMAPTGIDVRPFIYTPPPVDITALAVGPMGDALALVQINDAYSFFGIGAMGDGFSTMRTNDTVSLFAVGPMGDAVLDTFEPMVINAMAIGPMGDATLRTIGPHFINLAVGPMGDAWAWIPNENLTFGDVGPMGDAVLTTTEFTNVEAMAIGPMGDGLITFSPQWAFMGDIGPMGDATVEIPNVYVTGMEAVGPMGDATVEIPNVYVKSLFARGPMGDATASFERWTTTDFVAVGPMGDAVVSFRGNGSNLVALGPMGDAVVEIPNVYFPALVAVGPMGEAFVDVDIPPHMRLDAVGPMGDAAIGLESIDTICRRRSMIIVQVF